jgi:hypothetical protein
VVPESIAQLVNQNSFLVLSLGGWLALAVVLLRRGLGWRQAVVLAVAAAVLATTWLGLRRDAAASDGEMTTAADFEAALGQGQPVLLQFYSNY